MRCLALLLGLTICQTAWARNLTFVGVSGPSTPLVGSNQTFTVTIRNDSPSFTTPFQVDLRASTDATYDATDTAICTGDVTGGFGTHQQRVFTFVCPWPASPANPYVVARLVGVTPAPISDTNTLDDDAHYGPLQVAGAGGIDLSAGSPATSGPLAPGAAVALTYQLTNTGSQAAGNSRTEVRWSTDTTWDVSDPVLCSDQAPGVGTSTQLSRVVSGCAVPPTATTGTYQLLLRVDADAQIQETDETNNLTVHPVDVVVPITQPDLTLSALDATQPTAAGSLTTLTFTARNDGAGHAPAHLIAVRLSANTTYGASKPLLCTVAVPALPSGQAHAGQSSCQVPPGTPAGAGFLVARVDDDTTVSESDEGNNTRSTPFTVAAPTTGDLADLTIPAAGGVPSVPAGSTVSVSYTLLNDGTGEASSSTTKAWLSADAAWDPSDALLCQDAVPALAATTAAARALSGCAIPAATAAGAWQILLQADADATVPESDEGNNVRPVSLTVRAPGGGGPDTDGADTDAADTHTPSDSDAVPPDSDLPVPDTDPVDTLDTPPGQLGCRCAQSPPPTWPFAAWLGAIAWARRRPRAC